jgi:hypothetical protein
MLHAKGTSRRTVKFDALDGNRRGGERKLGGVLQRVVDCKFFVNFKLEVFGGVIVHTLSLPQLKVRGKLLVISQIYS